MILCETNNVLILKSFSNTPSPQKNNNNNNNNK